MIGSIYYSLFKSSRSREELVFIELSLPLMVNLFVSDAFCHGNDVMSSLNQWGKFFPLVDRCFLLSDDVYDNNLFPHMVSAYWLLNENDYRHQRSSDFSEVDLSNDLIFRSVELFSKGYTSARVGNILYDEFSFSLYRKNQSRYLERIRQHLFYAFFCESFFDGFGYVDDDVSSLVIGSVLQSRFGVPFSVFFDIQRFLPELFQAIATDMINYSLHEIRFS